MTDAEWDPQDAGFSTGLVFGGRVNLPGGSLGDLQLPEGSIIFSSGDWAYSVPPAAQRPAASAGAGFDVGGIALIAIVVVIAVFALR